MHKGHNINFNSVGMAGCASLCCLLLLAIGLAVPLSTSTAYADENEVSAVTDNTRYETSTVSIDFTRGVDSSADGKTVTATAVTPMKDGDGKSRVTIDTKISVTNSAKYEVYIGSDSEYLRKDGTSNTDRLNPISGNPTYDNIGINEWGYAWAPKDSFNEKTVTYSAMPGTVRGTAFDSNNQPTEGKDEREYTISFAANFGTGMTSGVYSSKVTLSVISNPTEVANAFGIATMQEMTSAVCTRASSDAVAQLEDTRDHKFYWVGKMPDNRCWMTQNLDLDLSTSTALKGDTTNLGATKNADVTWTPGQTTTTDSMTVRADNTGQWSWSMGGDVGGATDYYTTNPNSTTSCGYTLTQLDQASGASNCSDSANGGWALMAIPTSANGDTNAHRLLGNFYQWCAATAGCKNSANQTGSDFTSGEATADICPYGWRLPTGNTTGELQALATALGAYTGSTNVASKLTDEPFYAVRGGVFDQYTDYKFYLLGSNGRYWSSTASNGSQASNLRFDNTTNVYPSNTTNRQFGYSVRCINNPDVQ